MNKRDWFLNPAEISPDHIPKFDFHMHTTWTDGTASTEDMYAQALAEGLKAVLFSEHSRKTSGDWFAEFAAEVRAVSSDSCRAFVGTEVKVNDANGNLDLSPEVRALVDFVIVSVHRFPDADGGLLDFKDVSAAESEEREYMLSMAALDNKDTDILGHPFGMTLKRYQRMPVEKRFRQIIEKCAHRNIAFDISGSYHPNPWQLLDWCKDAGASVVLGSDAHTTQDVGRIQRILSGKEAPCTISELP
jgi:histidinol phosphatase-like PHP family hydrolase